MYQSFPTKVNKLVLDDYRKGEDNMEESAQHFSLSKENFHFFCFSRKKTKILKFLERIFHCLRDILDILDSSRYFSSLEAVNYHFLFSFQIMMQIYNPFDMQGFYHR